MPPLALRDLVIGYRRAKSDLHYSSDPRLLDLLEYEENLRANLESLLARIRGRDQAWTSDPDFVGSFSLMPKSVSRPIRATRRLIWSDPTRAWAEALGPGGEGRPEAEFRLMARCSIDLHVLATVWMMTAGARLEAKIADVSYGSRLRRTRSGAVNRLAPSSFRYYLTPYRQWRDRGLQAMRDALDDDQAAITLTADATAYYHRLDPTFLLDESFAAEQLGVTLSATERKVNRLFVRSLQAWAESVADETGWTARGLPVGLPASAVVANLALVEFDRIAMEQYKPLYYGRYVDDIILVLRDGDNLRSVEEVWDWLASRSEGKLQRSTDPYSIKFLPDYLEGSEIEFAAQEKNKIFHLSGPSGEFLLGSIKRTIDEQTSRWRSLPSISSDAARIGTDIAVATSSHGEPTTTLRDADQVSARRAAFAIRLRDFEAYERDLDPSTWSEHRTAFFQSVSEQVLALPQFFEFASYVPRLIKLAAACGDVDSISRVFRALANVYTAIVDPPDGEPCELKVKEFADPGTDDALISEKWLDQLLREAYESLLAGGGGKLTRADVSQVVGAISEIDTGWFSNLGPRALQREHTRLFLRDLAHVPYRFRWLTPEFAPSRGIPTQALQSRYDASTDLPADEAVRAGLDLLMDRMRDTPRYQPKDDGPETDGSEISGLRFATRPFSMLELYLLLHGSSDGGFGLTPPGVVRQVLLAVRGHSVGGPLPRVRPGKHRLIDVRARFARAPRRIALSMFYTSIDAWKAAAIGRPDLSRQRYDSIMRPLTELINAPIDTDYLLLPESSIPSTWFVRIAGKLQLQDINLVAGIEYRAGRTRRTVYNQVWSALRIDGLGFPGLVVLRQDKQRPAPHEETHLRQIARRRLAAEIRWKQPPIVIHGGFAFATLVCSELTNISYRAGLRGRIDTLFVVEWNQDLHTFEALVEASALDIHTFVAQANHRTYGDSRLRAPRSDDWARDVVRLRGGTHDYVVVGEVDFHALRDFQSAHRVSGGPFKPLPDGFRLASWRRGFPMLGDP